MSMPSSKLMSNSRVRVEEFYDHNTGRKSVQHFFDHPSKTDQSFQSDCDINLMVKRFMKSQRWDNTAFNNYFSSLPSYVFSDQIVDGSMVDYDTHKQAQFQADEMFKSLPSGVRARFMNKPGDFLSFVLDPSNRAELADMGLLKPEVAKSLKDLALASKTPSKGESPSSPAVSST